MGTRTGRGDGLQCADPCPPPAPAGPGDSGAGAERHLPALATRGEPGSLRRARVFVLVRGRAPPRPRAADAAAGGWVGGITRARRDPGAPGPGRGGAEPVPGRQPPIGAPGAGEPSRPPGPLPGRRAAMTAIPEVGRGAGRGAVVRRRRGRARLSSSGTDRGEEPAPAPRAFGLFVCERLVPRARSLWE